jgi:hypothetical protein
MEFIENHYLFFSAVLSLMIISYYSINKIVRNSSVSIGLILGKFGLPVSYFLFWSAYRPVILLDDQKYFHESIGLFEKAKGSLMYLFSADTILEFMITAGGYHFGYFVYNYISFWLFGPYYYAPVIANILISVLTASIFYRTIIFAQLSNKASIFIYIFFLLHWDVLTWSSFINIKDTFVLFLSVSALYLMIVTKVKGLTIRTMLLFILILVCFYTIRFYFCFFLGVTGTIFLIMTQLSKIKGNWMDLFIKISILVVLPICFYIVFIFMYARRIDSIGPQTNIFYGFPRYILTPFPLNIEPDYSFIFISSTLHWLLLPILPYGLYLFIKRHFYTLMPYVIMFLLLSVFYGSFAELQGPRHRIPQAAFLCILQALSIYEILASVKKYKIKQALIENINNKQLY